jgi:hypothetical protein
MPCRALHISQLTIVKGATRAKVRHAHQRLIDRNVVLVGETSSS